MPRPRLHLAPATGWINDPLGLTYRAGVYHVFYQLNPHDTVWAAQCHWGHATSPDLVSWAEQPVALAPGEGDEGCWSGCVVTDADDSTTLFYTCVARPDLARGRVRTAYPDPTWTHWTKADIVVRPPREDLVVFRDPFVLRDGEVWRMVVGAGLRDGTATALTFVSTDLRSWEHDGMLPGRSVDDHDPVWTGSAWECPQLVRLGDRHALIVSVWHDDELHHVAGALGRYADGRFEVERWQQLTYGPSHYAASTFCDADGRVGLVTWLREAGPVGGSWRGAMSLPMALTADDAGLTLSLHPAVERGRHGPMREGECSTVYDVEWVPTDGRGTLMLVDDLHRTLSILTVAAGVLRVQVEGDVASTWEMPAGRGPIRLVVDAGLLEVVTDGGAGAGQLSDSVGSYPTTRDGSLSCWRL